MSRLTDTHAHLYSEAFASDLDAVLARARAQLEAVYLPNVSPATIPALHQLAERAPGFCFPMMGLHPCEVGEDYPAQLAEIESFLRDPARRYYGIGETGLDLYWDKGSLDRQRASLAIHIEWAKEFGLPIILHAREAIDPAADMIGAALDGRLRGVFHCFDGTLAQAERILGFGSFKLGIGGILTYRKEVQQMVRGLPREAVVLETDSPYLPPEPYRKQHPRRNEPAYTREVALALARIWEMPFEQVAEITTRNARALFGA
jgi:TatD DNase family protein